MSKFTHKRKEKNGNGYFLHHPVLLTICSNGTEKSAILQPCIELRDCVILNCDTHNDKRVIVTIIIIC